VRRPDGSACVDEGPSPSASLDLRSRGDRVEVRLFPLAFDALARTRCPGPSLGDLGAPRRLAVATIPRSALAREAFTVRLRPRAAFGDGLARGRLRGELVLTLRRTGD